MTNGLQVPEAANHEALVDNTEQVLNWLAYAGNDERKLITILALGEADTPLGQTALSAGVDNLAGRHVTGELKVLRTFCETTLEEVGAVESTRIEVVSSTGGHYSGKGFYLTPENRDFAISFAGALSKWSFCNPELSLALLGSTSSNSSSEGARAPIRRFRALYELATHPDDAKSPALIAIANELGLDPSTNGALIKRLEQKGILTHASSRKDHAREFTIIQPEQIETEVWSRETISDTTRLLFDGFKAAHTIKDTWQTDEFLAFLAEKTGASIEQIKQARVRLQDSFKPGNTYLAQNIEVGERKFDAGSRVELLPQHAAAVKDLVAIIDGFCSADPEIMAYGAQAAEEIIHNPAAVAGLFEKGIAESKRRISDKEFTVTVTSLISKLGGAATQNALRDAYTTETGRNFASNTFTEKLGMLTAKGIIESIVQPQRTDAEPVPVYSLVGQETNNS